MPLSDRQLLKRIPSDPDALDVFYRRHVAAVTRFVARRTAGPEDLADIIAEVFVTVIESAPKFDGRREGALPWLFGIAVNKSRELDRARGRAGELALKLHGRGELPQEEYALLEERIDAELITSAVRSALDDLPARDRALLELVALDEMSPRDAAALLGMKAATVRMRLTRIRRRLRAELAENRSPVSTHGTSRMQGEMR